MIVVFDTNVLISSTLWHGSVAQKLLFNLIRKEVKIFTSKAILSEYQKVLKRDFDYSDEEIVSLMEKILSFATLVEPEIKVNVIKDDPEDNKVIECAIESSATFIITYDNHLLKLQNYKGIKIIKPEEIINTL